MRCQSDHRLQCSNKYENFTLDADHAYLCLYMYFECMYVEVKFNWQSKTALFTVVVWNFMRESHLRCNFLSRLTLHNYDNLSQTWQVMFLWPKMSTGLFFGFAKTSVYHPAFFELATSNHTSLMLKYNVCSIYMMIDLRTPNKQYVVAKSLS